MTQTNETEPMEANQALEEFQEAAIEWTAGARGIVLVDAAANALAGGLDSPTLRVLAGAPRLTADAEANEYAATVFAELGLAVSERFAPEAIVAWARLKARQFLDTDGDPRPFARTMSSMWSRADFSDALYPFDMLDERYLLTEDGYYTFAVADIDASVVAAARRLAADPPNSPAAPPRAWRFLSGAVRRWRGVRRRA